MSERKGQRSESAKLSWSGFETKGMKQARCSLLLPRDIKLRPRIKTLPPQTVHIHHDSAWDSSDQSNRSDPKVDFEGCIVMQLETSNDNRRHSMMPVTMTVGGRCHFTIEAYKNFMMMMRTNEQSLRMNIMPNGNFEWPDVKSFRLCPICHEVAGVPEEENGVSSVTNEEYWMLFYPLVQFSIMNHSKVALGTRTICRLACIACFENLLNTTTIKIKRTIAGGGQDIVRSSVLSPMDVLNSVGSVSFFQDEPPRPESHSNIDDVMDVWTLYCLWEQSGAWEALQLDYRSMLTSSMSVKGVAVTKEEPQDPSGLESEQLKPFLRDRLGEACNNDACDRIHGRRDASLGRVVRLSTHCLICRSANYCSTECREEAYEKHNAVCVPAKKTALSTAENKGEKEPIKVTCSQCRTSRPFTEMKACAQCRSVAYCSVDCQKEGWNFHKSLCVKTRR